MSRRNRLLPFAVLILGAPLLLAASGIDDTELVGSILDDPDPAGKAFARFRDSTGFSGELIAQTTIDGDGAAVTVVRAVVFPSPFGGCDDLDDCNERIKKACLEEGMNGTKPGTVKLIKGDSCSGQCAGVQLVFVEVSCPKPVEPPPPPRKSTP